MSTTKQTTINPNEVVLEKYPKMVQRYFVRDSKGELSEVFKLNASSKPKDGAQVYSVLTSTGKIHKFAAEVVTVDKEAEREKRKLINDAQNRLIAGEITVDSYTQFVKELMSV